MYTTVSGWSGGSGFANNVHVVHSETFKGVGVINGGPYAVGEYLDIGGIFQYKQTGSSMATESVKYANQMSSEGKIDNVSNLNNAPVVIFSSGLDSIMPKAMQDAQKEFYENFGANVNFTYNADYQHGWPVDISPDELPAEPCTKFNYPV